MLISPIGKPNVLVVEQDADSRLLIRDALKGVCNPSFAALASTIFARLLERPYNLVITATTRPGNMHSRDVLHIVKALPGYEYVPVIGIASNAPGADDEPPFADPVQGFAAYFSQRPTPVALRRTVLRLLPPVTRLQPG